MPAYSLNEVVLEEGSVPLLEWVIFKPFYSLVAFESMEMIFYSFL